MIAFDVVLWPLFHYILWDEATDGRIEKKSWDDYVFVNQQFADAIVEQYQTGDIGMFSCCLDQFLNWILLSSFVFVFVINCHQP